MKRKNDIEFDILIDKLTNSIENVITGDSFQTVVSIISAVDLKLISKKNKWLFNWLYEYKQSERDVYKLTIVGNPTIIQGLMSIEVKPDHVYMHIVENAPFNKGKEKMYAGVPGNLVAFACRLSFQLGHAGNVSFVSKSQLIEHYENTLGAIHFGGRVMVIETKAAIKLIDRYFKNWIMKKQINEPDYVGGHGSLTKEEENALSRYFSEKKAKISKQVIKKQFLKSKPITT